MYIPKLHEETDLAVLHALIRAHPLGTWATQGEGGILMNHVPFLLDPGRGPYGTLVCHVARANTVWQTFCGKTPSVIAFQGAEAYITPSWYVSKRLHGKVVPTWNYAVVHVHGVPVIMKEQAQLLEHLRQLTDSREANRPAPWQVSDAPEGFIMQMSQQIVGIEIPIAGIVGKWKVSQNRSAEDRLGVVSGLAANGDAGSREMAELVGQAMLREPEK